MAASRSKRANAGCRMKEVMEKADDPFYNNLYGGFYDEEDDAVSIENVYTKLIAFY